jgi:nicotinamidase-related amidase
MNIFIVDMLEGFTRLGPLASPRVEALIPKQVAFLEKAPADSVVVIVGDAHDPEDPEFKVMPVHCLRGTKEAEVCPEILEVCQRRGFEVHYEPKVCYSAFFHTGLEFHHIFRQRIEWVMFGCVTDVCISANVQEMFYRGRHVTLVKDLIDTYELPGHDPAEFNKLFFEAYMPATWGVDIKTAEELLS